MKLFEKISLTAMAEMSMDKNKILYRVMNIIRTIIVRYYHTEKFENGHFRFLKFN